ncbi:putative peptidase [Polystyrenella longa]|uniref:Putative peptidase n=1 Tax=Polystyrenella longa TaxID=2528007 RepID=A0A518CTZ5_9PLAN|nr:Xaa-Pro peptidase family protein [Polystyrenella longa]QDU82706.1 putative peptidase [Polystyrenella longa]
MSSQSQARRKRLLRLLKKKQLGAILVSNPVNVSYLTGFTGDDSMLLLSSKRAILISDSRFETQISQECPDLDAEIRSSGQSMYQILSRLLSKMDVSEIGFEASNTTYSMWQQINSEVSNVTLTGTTGLVEELRQIKDAGEITELREAIQQAEKGFAVLQASLVPDMTEQEAAHELEHIMRRFGAKGASFEIIVAVGTRAALPHARPTTRKLGEAGFVLIDWGATNQAGYNSDLTRVLWTGRLTPKLTKIYNVTLEAQQKAIEAIRPGISCRELDNIARSSIEKAGYGKKFGHGLGHGIGLDIHEAPRVGPSSETVLEPGMVITVEPGIYLPEWGGVRIEDDVLVTKEGYEVLTSVPKDLEISRWG